jgi:hypothetical protein
MSIAGITPLPILLTAGVLWMATTARAAIINVPADYPTISAAVAAASPGDEIVVAPGTYNENVLINKNNLTLRSSGGKAVTTIIGTLSGGNGTVMIDNGINGVTIGKSGQGFTIIGYDGPGGIETAAIYLLGAHQNILIEGNNIQANGEHGLLSNFNANIDNIIIRDNEFTGQTFVGPEPSGCGFATQFDPGNNVPRQLVTMGGGATVTNSKNVTFVENVITGTAGGYNSAGSCEQGNFLVTIDVIGATIANNVFNGTTTRFAGSLRARGQATTVTCNIFYNTGLGSSCTHIFYGSSNPLTGSATPTLASVATSNAFPGGGAYLTPDHPSSYVIYRNVAQATVAAGLIGAGQTVNAASSALTCPVTNNNTGKQFCSITSAIQAASTLSGHVLAIPTCTYVENVDAATPGKNITLAPGTSPGCVTISGNMTLNSGDVLDMEINNTTPCTGHDQFIVNGTVTLGGATLSLTITHSFSATDVIVLINNDGTDPVVGTFAQGSSIIVSGTLYHIIYDGGTGNDVVLRRACGNVCTAPVTFTGNITISTQAQMNAFKNSSGCKYTHVTGNLTIDGNGNASTGADAAGGDPITDLCNLQELLSVGGNLTIRDFNVAGNPTNLNDLNKLQTVGGTLTIGPNNANDGNNFTSISLPNLTTVIGSLNAYYNNNSNTFSFTSLASTGSSATIQSNGAGSGTPSKTIDLNMLTTVGNNLTIQNNGTGVTSIDLSSLTNVGGSLSMSNTSSNDISGASGAAVNLGSLGTVGGNMTLTRAGNDFTLNGLNITGNLTVSNNAALMNLNTAGTVSVGGTLTIANNPALTHINMSSPFSGTTGNVSVTGNSTLFIINIGVSDVLGNVTIQSNGTGVVSINLSSLTNIGGNLSMNNNAANAITASINLSSLTNVGGNATFTRTAGGINAWALTVITGALTLNNNASLSHTTSNFSSLSIVGSNFTLNNNGSSLTSFDGLFSALVTVAGNLTIQGNSALSTCCRLLCDIVVLGTKNISGNASGCATMANITATCAGSECPSGFTRNTDLGECNYTSGSGEFDLDCPASTVTYAYLGPGGFSGSGVSTLDGLDFPVGTTTITATITTSSPATTGTCTFTVTVNDNEPPVVTPSSIASCYSSASSAETAAIGATTATDNCGTPTKTANTSMSGCTATITVTATDGAGNSATTTYTTTIDGTAPTVTAGTIGSCYPTVALAEAAAIAATTATDGCSTPTKTASTVMSGCTATIAVTATDGCGNTASVTYTTTIDGTAPTVTAGTIASCYPTVAAAEAAAIAATTATDACSTPTKTANTVGTCSATITVTATDACGNTASVTYTTSIDNTAPTVTAGTIASCYPTVAAAEAAAIAATTATDACSTPTKTANTVGTCSATITVTATDACGNTASVTYTTSIDNTAPTVTAGTIASCYPTVAAAEAAAIAATTATDGCSTPTKTANTVMSGCTATIAVTATDGCGNTASVTYTTTIDGTAPTITCPATQNLTLGPSCTASLPNYTILATASDNCGTPTVTQLPTPGTAVSGTGPMTLTLTAADACGNTAACTFTVNKVDVTSPTFTFVPANVTVQCNSVPSVGTPTATDACGPVTITYLGQTTTAGSCPDAYTLTRTWRATDASNNSVTATQTITVIDTQKPNFTSVPANVTVQCNAIPAVGTPTATDNCDASVAITYIGQTSTAGSCANQYTLTRRWVAADNCGNTRSTSQVITVIDTNKPFFVTFPNNVTIQCSDPTPPVASPTASDSCGTASVTYLGQTTSSGVCPNNYQIKRTWRATDACGNSTVRTQTIQVIDNTPPVFTSVPANVTINCNQPLPPLGNPTATDACGGYVHITFLGNTPSGSGCESDYTIIRTWRADDLCGNSATATQVITVKAVPFSPGDVEERADVKPQAPVWDDDRLLTLQPNPTTDRVLIGLGRFAGERVVVSIHNDMGQLLWERTVEAVPDLLLPVSLRESGASAGLYTVSVRSSNRVVAKRLVLIE